MCTTVVYQVGRERCVQRWVYQGGTREAYIPLFSPLRAAGRAYIPLFYTPWEAREAKRGGFKPVFFTQERLKGRVLSLSYTQGMGGGVHPGIYASLPPWVGVYIASLPAPLLYY